MSSTVSVITGKNKYERLLEYSRFAQAVYGIGNSAPLSVAGAIATKVERFEPTDGSGFNGALYKEIDPLTGNYRYVIAFAGTVDMPDAGPRAAARPRGRCTDRSRATGR